MLESDLLSPGRIVAGASFNSKKRLLEFISLTLAKKNPELDAREIFESLCARENLGSTGLGKGVAIPHGRAGGIEGAEGLFLQLSKPISFDAYDGQEVDLIYALGLPMKCSEEHSKLLSSISERFSDEDFQQSLRQAMDASEVWQVISDADK